MRTPMTAVAVLVAASLAVGCASAGGPGSSGATSPAGGTTPGPSATITYSPVARQCGPPDAPGRLITVRAAGARLEAAEAGAGPRGVVLLPELGRLGMCGWWAYAVHLSRSGYHVLMFDHRCVGESSCPPGPAGIDLMADVRAAAAQLRRDGATRIALMGASQGGCEAVIAATVPPPGVTGVVALSADELTMRLAARPYRRTALAAAPQLRLPVLFAVAAADPYVSVPSSRHLLALAGSSRKRLIVLPAGSGHGWDLVTSMLPGRARASFSRALRGFLHRTTS
jgi:alpha-beta hydrolase superfamily lysophospholipase